MERRKPSTTKPKVNMNPKEPMTKLQKQVTAWMKKHVPTKRTKFLYSHVVDYFSGKKAIDMLMEESPWAASSADSNETQNQDFAFESREQCVEFLDLLLRYKMFHRAKKVPVTEESGRKGKKKDKSDSEDNEVAKQEQVFLSSLLQKPASVAQHVAYLLGVRKVTGSMFDPSRVIAKRCT